MTHSTDTRPHDDSRRPRALRSLAALLLVAPLVACGSTSPTDTDADTAATTSASASDASGVDGSDVATTGEDHDDAADHEWDTADEIAVTLDGDTADVEGGAGVEVSGTRLTFTSAGTYRLTGTWDGQVTVETADPGIVRLVLDGVTVTSEDASALVVDAAEEVMLVLADGSTNVLTDGDAYATPGVDTDGPNAAVYSMADLTIAGDGALEVTGNANDGIASKDGLVITGGVVTVTAVDDAVRGKDYVLVEGGTLDLTAGGDGLKADNADDDAAGWIRVAAGEVSVDSDADGLDAQTDLAVTGGALTVTAADDAVHATGSVVVHDGNLTLEAGDDGVHADAALTIAGGTLAVTGSYEGLEAAQVTVAGGDITVRSTDDGVNVAGGADASGGEPQAGQPGEARGDGFAPEAPAAGTDTGTDTGTSADTGTASGTVSAYHLAITGGTLVIDADGDGLDSNGTAEMTGGTVVVSGPTESMNGAIDVQNTFEISGGTLVAAGSSGMAETPDESSAQAWLGFDVGEWVPAGQVLQVVAADGSVLAAFEAGKEFSSFVLSSPELVSGADYSVYLGGTPTGELTGGLALDGDLAGAELLGTLTVTG